MCSCGAPLEDFSFCSKCGSLCETTLSSPFQVFALDTEFSLDFSKVHKAYLAIQNRLHPDRFFNNEAERKLAQRYSSHVNWAYRTLKDPIQRAEILLDSIPDNFPVEDLMEQMQKREHLESLSDKNKLIDFRETVLEERADTEKLMAFFFKEKELDMAKKNLIKIKYLIRLEQESLNKIEES